MYPSLARGARLFLAAVLLAALVAACGDPVTTSTRAVSAPAPTASPTPPAVAAATATAGATATRTLPSPTVAATPTVATTATPTARPSAAASAPASASAAPTGQVPPLDPVPQGWQTRSHSTMPLGIAYPADWVATERDRFIAFNPVGASTFSAR